MPADKYKKAAKSAAKTFNKTANTPPTRLHGKPAMKEIGGQKRGYGTVAKKYPKYKGSTPKASGASKQARKTYKKK